MLNIRLLNETFHTIYTVCPGRSDPFFIVTYYIKSVTTSWTYSMYNPGLGNKIPQYKSVYEGIVL